MPKTWNQIPLDDLQYEAASLMRSAKQLEEACKVFAANDITLPWTTWTDAMRARIAAIASLARDTLAEVEDQVTAKRFGKKCHVEQEKERAAREIARRTALEAALKSAAPANEKYTKKPTKRKGQ